MPKKFIHPFLSELHTCLLCGARLEASTNGRPRKFCSDAHRKAHNKKNSVKNIIKHYNAITKEFFSTANSDDRQKQLVKWGREYALWCNGEHPTFAKTKDALLNVNIPRPKAENETGKNIHDRMIAYLRSLGIEDQKIYDRLSVVRAFGLEPSPELLAEPAATSNVIPMKVKPPVKVIEPVKIDKSLATDTATDDWFEQAFAEPTTETAKPPVVEVTEVVQPVEKPVIAPKAQTLLEGKITQCLREAAASNDPSDKNLFRIIREFTLGKADEARYLAALNDMVERGDVKKSKDDKGRTYHILTKAIVSPSNVQKLFWHSGLKYLNSRPGTTNAAKQMANHFKSRFGMWPSDDVRNSVAYEYDSGEAEKFIKAKFAEFAKSKAVAA
ncbi:hypothetical protein [Cereibacter changlensis]|uniref:hypothetical protein n=1 Tax=Cereibacter changlensis TaxID=402884 RepID=UPI0040337600